MIVVAAIAYQKILDEYSGGLHWINKWQIGVYLS